ncbi:hypothetical protein GQS78_08120 [Thermococcus bergensis]|jgi:hypothetical protein|uniref:hypothetical protein n=1 Tax=Thermococcus bergensis TaxID=2689387 RepID=UPI001CEC4670|nr:hypothetical protein [Thermococcus bergensis]MCA6214211.1 hypothetical protein [Thermococcus bergensis]
MKSVSGQQPVESEKKAVLSLYALCIVMAISIFLYMTKVRGYTVENSKEVALAVFLPTLAVYFLGAAILKRSGIVRGAKF